MNEIAALPDMLVGAFGPIRRPDARLYHRGTIGGGSSDFQAVGVLRHHNHCIYAKMPRSKGHGLGMVPAGVGNDASSASLRTELLERRHRAADLEGSALL